MLGKDFPIQKSDVHYNAETQEVTLPREKFDQLIGFVRELVGQVEAAEDQRDVARYRSRRAEGFLAALEKEVQTGSNAIGDWVDAHSVMQLSQQSGIPYATCHRMVRGQLEKSMVKLRDFFKLIKVVDQPTEATMSFNVAKDEKGHFVAKAIRSSGRHAHGGRIVLGTSHKEGLKSIKLALEGTSDVDIVTADSGEKVRRTM